MFKNNIILLFAISFVLYGCGYKQTSVQSRDIGYLKFLKTDSKQFTVMINNKNKFTLDGCINKDNDLECVDTTENKLYEVTSGNIDIQVFNKQGELILHRNSYLGSSSTMEVVLP